MEYVEYDFLRAVGWMLLGLAALAAGRWGLRR